MAVLMLMSHKLFFQMHRRAYIICNQIKGMLGYIPLILTALLISESLLLFRNFVFLKYEILLPTDYNFFFDPINTLLGLHYALAVTFLWNQTLDKMEKICDAVIDKKKADFVRTGSHKIRTVHHLFVGVSASVINFKLIAIQYETEVTGIVIITSVSFVMSLLLLIVIDNDNVVRGRPYKHLQKDIPDDWLRDLRIRKRKVMGY